jgi:hypothetical protein
MLLERVESRTIIRIPSQKSLVCKALPLSARVVDSSRSAVRGELMDLKNYGIEASLHYMTGANMKKRTLVFQRFARAADAIRFVIEGHGPGFLDGCSLEVNEGYYFGREIRPLYDDRAYPLRRRGRANAK